MGSRWTGCGGTLQRTMVLRCVLIARCPRLDSLADELIPYRLRRVRLLDRRLGRSRQSRLCRPSHPRCVDYPTLHPACQRPTFCRSFSLKEPTPDTRDPHSHSTIRFGRDTLIRRSLTNLSTLPRHPKTGPLSISRPVVGPQAGSFQSMRRLALSEPPVHRRTFAVALAV